MKLSGNIVDIVEKKIFPGHITVEDGKITAITPTKDPVPGHYIMPGFVDSHVHVESSMLIPSEFARLAVVHGTVATVSDPHEIGNVLGIKGVRYMINNGKKVPFNFYFGAPSCVPATEFETAGAHIGKEEIDTLFTEDGLVYLSEMMNYPGVLHRDPLVMDKIAVAKKHKLKIDGHSPGLKGKDAENYISAGISTDHECYMLDEAEEKIHLGMKVLIREGSAAKNYPALHTLIRTYPDMVMFCSDDKHPNDLVDGHINELVKRSIIDHGYDLFDVLRIASYNPIKHYGLNVGLLQVGDPLDCIVVNNLKDFSVLETYIKGQKVAEKGKSLIASVQSEIVNNFNISEKREEEFHLPSQGNTIQVIVAEDGQLITKKLVTQAKIEKDQLVSDPDRDILKLVVVNRYQEAPPAIAFVQGFGLKKGALASCIAHDSHNIIAVGVDDASITSSINALIKNRGGIAVSVGAKVDALALPVAGIMSHDDGYKVAKSYTAIDQLAKNLGSSLHAPFMTLSFMSLLVIPTLKLSDKGLFDGETFTFTKNNY